MLQVQVEYLILNSGLAENSQQQLQLTITDGVTSKLFAETALSTSCKISCRLNILKNILILDFITEVPGYTVVNEILDVFFLTSDEEGTRSTAKTQCL